MKYDIRRNNRTIAKLNDLATAQKIQKLYQQESPHEAVIIVKDYGKAGE
ncbi:hypothetical protein [Leuconostoc citreum]|nr:hypothetical protein [Leuconostoc citreum]MBA5937558.1 hypothetical protein [Leuconostoc citreum]